MGNLVDHTSDARIIHVDFSGMVHLSQAKRPEGVLLILWSSDTTSDLCDSDFLHLSKVLSVKHSVQINTSQLSDGISVTHLGEGNEGSLHHGVRVGGAF